ncbi:MAG: hypothetical protein JSW73_03685 [Candidatus Woesearchaeota archaeon]|nr:MAG: hypothetical protein JSW73_03685 [Candidatus Woesearchaeota archaeon]
MVNQQLVDYIKRYKKRGYSSREVVDYLVSQGYDSEEISEALKYVKKTSKLPHYKFFLIGAIILVILGVAIIFTQSMHLIRLDLILTTALILVLISVILKSRYKM